MATPPFITDLRTRIGHDLLWLPGVTALVFRQGESGPELLLVQRADDGSFTPITGIPDPGEQPDEAARREAREEACVDIEVTRLLRVQATDEVQYGNGDRCVYMDTAFVARLVDPAQQPAVGDDESTVARFVPVDQLPPMKPRFEALIAQALAGDSRPAGWGRDTAACPKPHQPGTMV
ncbi:hypothetical protein C1Y63_08075 [Corynebacterium sp. 13CS0277]|uniref:NUDIX hydrolase n=1 Tax=Corynebacterium sp. 13CS0277 TaxID=2071994 RepID=UPI000D041D98|nr:NUDIX domain-containing protein [Corynebacterium sp. 13CS0277]PRQ11075.1 hypothetical protein C1Y63_08075 [Corynebacterium sp. 13CS0277]